MDRTAHVPPPVLAARRLVLALLVAPASLAFASCSNSGSQCSAPTSGSFTLALKYSQSVPIDLVCDGSTGAADAGTGTCGAGLHAFDGATWKVDTSGASATVTFASTSWTCSAIGPQSGPGNAPDGASLPGSGCDLLLQCDGASLGDAGAGLVEIELLPTASSDVLVLVHATGGACCTDEYAGTWT